MRSAILGQLCSSCGGDGEATAIRAVGVAPVVALHCSGSAPRDAAQLNVRDRDRVVDRDKDSIVGQKGTAYGIAVGQEGYY